MSKRRKHKSRKKAKSRKVLKRRQTIRLSSKKKATQFFKEPNVSNVGFDYGVKPRIMSVFDLEFLNSWNEAKCVAIGYTMVDQYEVYSDLPLMTLGCQNTNAIKKLFDLIKSWMKPPGDQSAVDIFFVEDEKQKRYFYCMTVNIRQLILRTFGPGADQDYDILATAGCIVKKFAMSDNYKTFRKSAENRLVFLTWHEFKTNSKRKQSDFSSVTTLMTPNFESGFLKDDICFCDVSSLKPNTIEYALIHRDEKKVSSGPLFVHDPNAVFKLRRKQLRRFFPVTLSRLQHNPSFTAVKSALCSKYKDWQITQAACNLFARSNWPENGYGKNADMVQIYQKLRSSAQDSTEDATLTFEFDSKKVEEQIQLDIQYLHSYIYPESKGNPRKELESKGYLSDGAINNNKL